MFTGLPEVMAQPAASIFGGGGVNAFECRQSWSCQTRSCSHSQPPRLSLSASHLRVVCQASAKTQRTARSQRTNKSNGSARQGGSGRRRPVERAGLACMTPEAMEACRLAREQGSQVTAQLVLEVLRGTNFPLNTSRKSVMPEGQTAIEAFCLGLVGSRWAQLSEDTEAVSDLCWVLCQFIRGPAGPEGGKRFPFTSIQLNKKYASKRHVDANNAGYSMIIGLGDYAGGQLDVDGVGTLDVRNSWHRFDGNIPHCTTPVEGNGERFSLIYFTNSSLVHAEPGALLQLHHHGFNIDSLELAGGLETLKDVLTRVEAADQGAERCLVVKNLTAGIIGEAAVGTPLLEWHWEVRLFIRENTSSAQVSWVGLCLNGSGQVSDVGFVIMRHKDNAEAVSRALRKASKGQLRVQPYLEWRNSDQTAHAIV